MKQSKLFTKASVAFAFGGVVVLSACNSNDNTSATTTTTTDTTAPMAVDTTNMMNATDTTASMPMAKMDTASMSKAKQGMAKPDPAKKGKKGKAVIAEVTPAKIKADARPDESGVYKNVDYIPSFPGGYKGLQKYFDDNLEYPMDAQDNGVDGTVRIGFTVDENGKLMNPMIEGNNEGYGLDEEALRVVRKMPTWVPGKVNGKPVKTKFTLPVKFVLN
ncbi:MAG: energy transducer TonB [Ferruginibacter sp.]